MEHEPNRSQQSRENMLAISMVVFVGGIILFYLYIISLGIVGNVLAGCVIFVMVVTLHYFAWGRSLSEEIASERAALLRREAQEDWRGATDSSDGIQDLSRTQGIHKK